MGTRGKKKSPVKLIVVLSVLAVILALILAAVIYLNNILDDINGGHLTDETAVVEVVSGDTTAVIADKLEAAGVIQYPAVFRFMAGMEGVDTNLHIGKYEFAKGEKYEAILYALKQAPNYRASVRITFTEGMEVSDVIAKFLAVGAENEARWTSVGFEAALRHDYGYSYIPAADVANRLEGFLYPDTYDFFLDATETELFAKMIANFNQKATVAGLEAKAAARNMTLYEALTLGSIIQKEAGKVADFNMVSSVFHNRLRDDWLLQSDAAVSYPIPKEERLPSCTYEQLNTDTPYNVYMHKGLTPTPICNPSIDAAVAACEPAESDYFYFIGYVDATTGEQITVFAKTMKEHQANIDKYLK
ncbi:MAG: endolytic transglycosylase MltG [Clostridia bacterium]|nr:endolytic transglycosylase MltG [Clostridia bacterium]